MTEGECDWMQISARVRVPMPHLSFLTTCPLGTRVVQWSAMQSIVMDFTATVITNVLLECLGKIINTLTTTVFFVLLFHTIWWYISFLYYCELSPTLKYTYVTVRTRCNRHVPLNAPNLLIHFSGYLWIDWMIDWSMEFKSFQNGTRGRKPNKPPPPLLLHIRKFPDINFSHIQIRHFHFSPFRKMLREYSKK
jgi:hypothetical protein